MSHRKQLPLFRRTTPAAAPAPETTDKVGGKGRPTPTRKEAEAAARARAKVPRTRKEAAAANRKARGDAGQKMREAMKTGEERYLPARDKGPVKRFIRDLVDSRFSFIELMVPLLIISMVLGATNSARMVQIGNVVMLTTLMMIVIDMIFLRIRLRRELARRFPDQPTKGTTFYALMRSMQMKFMRLPKAQVRIGEQLPETYK